jgi:hypothetical protein
MDYRTGKLPGIFPDIADVTVPVNIAPLNFRINDYPDKTIAVFEGKNGTLRSVEETRYVFLSENGIDS